MTGYTDEHFIPSAITAAYPPQITYDGVLAISDGQRLRATKFTNLTGMLQLNNTLHVAWDCTATTFTLYDIYGYPIDGSAFSAHINGGQFTLTGPELFIEDQS